MREKDPYKISENKRFEISKDHYSRERLNAIKVVFQHIETSTPFKVGFSLYGSLSKGKILDKSNYIDADIDLSVFIDQESVEKNFDTFFKSNKKIPLDEKMSQTREYIKEKVKERLNTLSSNGELHKNIWMYDISVDIIENLVDNISENEVFEDSFYFRKVCRMFQLDVGGGMKKYRKLFLNYLSSKPEEVREKIWNNIITTLERKERYNKIGDPIKKQYPSTFLEAYKYYAS